MPLKTLSLWALWESRASRALKPGEGSRTAPFPAATASDPPGGPGGRVMFYLEKHYLSCHWKGITSLRPIAFLQAACGYDTNRQCCRISSAVAR